MSGGGLFRLHKIVAEDVKKADSMGKVQEDILRLKKKTVENNKTGLMK